VHGAALLADIDEVAQVCVPDLVVREQGGERDVPAYTVDAVRDATAQLVGDCHAAGRTALLQHPDPRALCDEAVRWSEGLDSSNAAVYWPWLRTADTSRPGSTVAVPPCGHVAGIIARCDLAVGSHKPPANEVVAGALGLTRRVDDVDHGRANANGVNAIKAVPGRGIRVLGARTTSRRERQWRYLNVRRLVTQIQRSVAAYAGWLVFEPHDRALREEVERVVRQLLDDVWRAGGLEGGTAEEAYSVRVEDPEAGTSVGEGALVVEIGLQPPYPAEHVVVRIDVPDPGVSRPAGGGGEGGRDR
jgi:phage tail sheath protein FI